MAKDMLIKEFGKVWSDKHMIDFCLNKTDIAVTLSNGKIVIIDKPTIQKHFCYGYHDYDNESFEIAERKAENASKNTEHFIQKNMEDAGFDYKIEELRCQAVNYNIWISPMYNEECNLVYWGGCVDGSEDIRDMQIQKGIKLDKADRELIAQAYEQAKVNFSKRLKAYLKRYVMTKVKTWSYWADR